MKKILWIFMLGLLLCGSMQTVSAAGVGPAAGPGPNRQRAAVLYVNVARTTYDSVIDQRVLDNIRQVLDGLHYEYVDGAPYIAKLEQQGISDVTMAEKADIVEALAGADVDYIVYVGVQPFVRKEKQTVFTYGIDMTAVVPLKIIDMDSSKYLYNGKFTEKGSDSTPFGLIGNKSVSLQAIDAVNKKITAVLKERLPQARPASAL